MAQVSISNPSPASQGTLLDDYMTDDECAAELDISPRTLARWDRLGCGPPFLKIGRLKRRPRGGTKAWLKSKEQGGGEA